MLAIITSPGKNSLTHPIFTEPLLCARHCWKQWGSSREQNRQNSDLCGTYTVVEETDN